VHGCMKHFDECIWYQLLTSSVNIHISKHLIRTLMKITYKEFLTKMPNSVDWSLLPEFEKEDTTSGGQGVSLHSRVSVK
jgi:hypothetical protein